MPSLRAVAEFCSDKPDDQSSPLTLTFRPYISKRIFAGDLRRSHFSPFRNFAD